MTGAHEIPGAGVCLCLTGSCSPDGWRRIHQRDTHPMFDKFHRPSHNTQQIQATSSCASDCHLRQATIQFSSWSNCRLVTVLYFLTQNSSLFLVVILCYQILLLGHLTNCHCASQPSVPVLAKHTHEHTFTMTENTFCGAASHSSSSS